MKLRSLTGTVVLSTAIGTGLLLGTFGWFAVGLGLMTDCTNNYSCSPAGCPPCASAGRWVNAGGLAQLTLAGTGIAVLVRGLRTGQRTRLAVRGAALLATSLLTVVGTTWLAQESYCRPGTAAYAGSYCSLDA